MLKDPFSPTLFALAAVSCSSGSGAIHPSQSDELAIVSDCPHSTPEPGYHVYECAGFAVSVTDEAPENVDPEADLRALRDGFLEGVESHKQRYGARVVVEAIPSPIADRTISGIKVLATDPANANEIYSAGYAVIVANRTILCTTSLNLGLEKCAAALEAFVKTAP